VLGVGFVIVCSANSESGGDFDDVFFVAWWCTFVSFFFIPWPSLFLVILGLFGIWRRVIFCEYIYFAGRRTFLFTKMTSHSQWPSVMKDSKDF
jgi:hypothetical protein